MGKPAATLTSYHVCPAKTGKKPHVGGPVVAGSSNVIIGGLPAARAGDKLVCKGPPDTIAQGSATVFVNGKAVARLGDATAHGGKIVVGNPTVIIGDASYSPTPDSGSAKASGPAGAGQSGGAEEDSSGASPAAAKSASTPPVNWESQRAALKKGNATCPICEAAPA